jgi:hypothetical protein
VLNCHDGKNLNSLTSREGYLSTDIHPWQTKSFVLMHEYMPYIYTPQKVDHFKYCCQVLKLRVAIQARYMKYMWVYFHIIVPYFTARVAQSIR